MRPRGAGTLAKARSAAAGSRPTAAEASSQAESNGAPQGMLDKIKNLGGRQFDGPQDVIGKLQG